MGLKTATTLSTFSGRRLRRSALGYAPERWPDLRAFGLPVTPNQVKMVGVKSRERGIPFQELPFIRKIVLGEYGVGDANSKGNACLFIDWLMNADEETIEAGIQAAMSYDETGEQSILYFEHVA